jgi:sigma-B regulation protein RsbU (phosphoserine phosphatase)
VHNRVHLLPWLAAVLTLFWWLALAAPLGAQAVAITSWPDGSIDLSHAPIDAPAEPPKITWRVQEGDNPAYASVDFDDQTWPTVPLAPAAQTPSKAQSGSGWRWYRLHVQLPSPHPPLALLVTAGVGTYEIFVNGEKLPGASLAPALFVTFPRARSFPVPPASAIEIALRTFVPHLYEADRGALRVRLGTQPAIANELAADLGARLRVVEPSIFINLLIVLTGLIVLLLFAAQRQRREYLWLGVSLVLVGTSYAAWTLTFVGFFPAAVDAPGNSAFFLSLAALVEFTFLFAGSKVNRGWRFYQLLLVFAAASMYLLMSGHLTALTFNLEQTLLVLPSAILLPIQLLIWYRQGNREAGWLIFPTMLSVLTLALYDFSAAAAVLGWKQLLRFTENLQIGPVELQPWDLANFLFVPAIVAVIFLRFSRLSRDQARAAAELDAARELQQRFVPAALPHAPGYRIQAAYVPAAEVGGDFFQILPQLDNATLIVVGDVSGKGLKAAMTGALAIGALRTLAAESLTPGAILTRLNHQMVNAQNGGFITCLCALLHRDGGLTMANAGHLAPYWNGVELVLMNGLPLGLTTDITYAETTCQMQYGDKLTLLTDGVLEARSPTGELYGFERTAAISLQSAEAITQAAQAFGQDDDITVLTLERIGSAPS